MVSISLDWPVPLVPKSNLMSLGRAKCAHNPCNLPSNKLIHCFKNSNQSSKFWIIAADQNWKTFRMARPSSAWRSKWIFHCATWQWIWPIWWICFHFLPKTLLAPPFSTLNWALPIWAKSRWTRAAQWATRDVAGIWVGWGRGGSRKRRLERRRAFGSAGAREEGEGAEERRGSEIPLILGKFWWVFEEKGPSAYSAGNKRWNGEN